MNLPQKSSLLWRACPGVERGTYDHAARSSCGSADGCAEPVPDYFRLEHCILPTVNSTGQAPDLQRCPLNWRVIIVAPTLHQLKSCF